MKRITRRPVQFEILSLLRSLSRADPFRLDLPPSDSAFEQALTDAVREVRSNPAAIYGRCTQEMFVYLAGSLGRTTLIVEVDAGEIATSIESLQAPDYHLVLRDKSQMLVEVKNSHTESAQEALRLRPGYLTGLRNYSEAVNIPLKLAVYWSRWNLWSLLPLHRAAELAAAGGVTMQSALMNSEMALLGDFMLGTRHPLVLRITPDQKNQSQQGKGAFSLTIAAVEMFCGGTKVEDKFERQLALSLMLLGDWPERTNVELRDGKILFLEFIYRPVEPTLGQKFEIIGSLSGIISRQFRHLTAEEGTVQRLSATSEPGELGILVPDEYSSEALPLWRFMMNPRPDDSEDRV